MEYINL